MTGGRLVGSILALLAAVAITASAYLPWLADREPRHITIEILIDSTAQGQPSSYWSSAALPLSLVTLFAALGVLFQARPIAALGWLVGGVTTTLLIVQSSWEPPHFGELDNGVWVAVVGVVVMGVGLASMARPKPVVVDEPISVLRDPNARFLDRRYRPDATDDGTGTG